MLTEIAVRHLRLLPVVAGPHDALQAAALRFELSSLGVELANPEAFTCISRAEFEELVATLKRMRGDEVSYVPLFKDFPDRLPDDLGYLFRRIAGFLGWPSFDITRYGADPVSQMQSRSLWERAAAEQSQRLSDTRVEWITLTIASETETNAALATWCEGLFYGPTAVQETLWDDLFIVLDQLPVSVDLTRVRVKETLARLALRQWQATGTIALKTPTDLLRMFAFQAGQDVSLTQPVSLRGLRLSKAQRRAIVQFLEGCPALEEDFRRYRGLWIRLLERIHPGDYRDQYPRLSQTFDDLRNDRLKSFEGFALARHGLERADALLVRPSLFLRRLSLLMQEVKPEALAERILGIDPEAVPLPLLMTVFTALQYRGPRAVINKAGRSWVLDGPQEKGDPVEASCLQADTAVESEPSPEDQHVLRALDTLILRKLVGTQDWGTVWIDPALFKLVLPLQTRHQSEGLCNLARGSRLAIGKADVLRLFVYWKQTRDSTDLDLSCLLLNRDFKYERHVGWNRYGGGHDVAHSGDIQDAPLGAAEFMDIRLASLQAGYLMPAILRYAGERFTALRACHAGWMLRDEVGSDTKAFDPATVAQKIAVARDGSFWIPFLLDIEANELVFVDLYSSGVRTIEGNRHFPKLARALAQYHRARPTFGQLAQWYLRAHHCPVSIREEADTTIGLDDTCTLNVLRLAGEQAFTLKAQTVTLRSTDPGRSD